ncbi:MAG: sensor histidine kinase [Myxococcaceae bacterium]
MLVVVGLFMWVISGVWLFGQGFEPRPAAAAWAVFLVPFLLVTRGRVKGRAALVLLLVQSSSAVVMGALARNLPAAMLAVVAGQIPFLLTLRRAVVLFVAQTLLFALGLLLAVRPYNAALTFASYAMFECFTFAAALLAVREQRAREALAQVNAELVATQAKLERSTRELERQRVSRELHDVLGHHLTALTLQLEVAKNVVEGKGLEPVHRADELARGALTEVRKIVSELRESEPLDLRTALTRVTTSVPGLTVHLEAPGTDAIDGPRALAVLRCVQEAVTNAARHSGASNLWLAINVTDGKLTVAARDDGRGTEKVAAGNGLNGLRERLGELGGELKLESAPGRGFTLTASLPLGAAA